MPNLSIDPEGLKEIATILARGYLRYRQSRSRQLLNCLDNTSEPRVHVPAVNAAEKDREAATTQEDDQ